MSFYTIQSYPKLKLILNLIYKKTLRSLYVKVISFRIKKNSEEFITETLNKIKKTKKKIVFNYKEYESIDLVSIYEGLKSGFIKQGYQTSNLKFELLPFGDYVKKRGSFGNKYSNYEKYLIRLKKQCKKFNQKNLYYALVDTIHKHHYIIWKNSFNGNFFIKEDFFNKINKLQSKISKIAEENDAIFFPDSSYIHNQLIKQEFLKKGKKAFVLSPSAGFYDCSDIYYSETSGKKNKKNIVLYNKFKKKINTHIKDRFQGNLIGDYDNISFKKSKFKNNLKNKTKILFLHSFTDANNQAWNDNQLFASHYEWTEYTIKQLSKIKFKNWFIKIHPVSQFSINQNQAFQNQAFGNDQILKYLIKKYKIPPNVFSDCPSTLEILLKKIPIYTNASTVVYETIIFGYKTFFTGSRFDGYFGNKILTKKEWKKALFKKNYKNNYKISKKLLNETKYLLWNFSSKHNISKFSSDGYVYSWDGHYQIFKLAIKFLFKMFFIKKFN